jgi:hypothetical protein
LRQISVLIYERLSVKIKAEYQLVAWQTRVLSEFVAATALTEEGKGNPLLEQAHRVGEEILQDASDKPDPDVQRENQPGSFELLTQTLSR